MLLVLAVLIETYKAEHHPIGLTPSARPSNPSWVSRGYPRATWSRNRV